MRRRLLSIAIMMSLALFAAAQEQSPQSLGEIAKENREARIRKSVETVVHEMCAKADDPKMQETYPKIQEKCKDTPGLVQSTFETVLKKDKENQRAHVKSLEDGGKSWVGKALANQSETQPSAASRASNSNSGLDEVQTMTDSLADKTARELGDEFAGDIQFPGRDQWEQKLYIQKQKLVAASQAYIDLMQSGRAAGGSVDQALIRMKIEQNDYSEIQSDGIARASDWEKK